MPIETICTGCARKLRVADEHAGKQARCPSCGAIYRVPASSFSQERDARAEQPDHGPSVYPSLAPGAPPVEGANPFARDPGTPAAGMYASPTQTGSTGFQQEHRGGTILTLGILALCCNICLIPGICAWVMGQADLSEMNAGRMDPSGRGLTQAGMILGIIGTILAGLSIVFQILVAMADM